MSGKSCSKECPRDAEIYKGPKTQHFQIWKSENRCPTSERACEMMNGNQTTGNLFSLYSFGNEITNPARRVPVDSRLANAMGPCIPDLCIKAAALPKFVVLVSA
jgi:hypothetical protein